MKLAFRFGLIFFVIGFKAGDGGVKASFYFDWIARPEGHQGRRLIFPVSRLMDRVRTLFMELQNIVQNYGYAAIIVGTFLEGETVLILAGLAAHIGYLSLPWAILAGFMGSLGGDQLFFYLGRKHSRMVLAKRPIWKEKSEKVHRLLDRFQTPVILLFRFLYGLRMVTPFVLGTGSVSAQKFLCINAAGALIWAAAVTGGGYFFGNFLEGFIGKIKQYEATVFMVVALSGLLIWFAYFSFRKRPKKLK